MSESSKTNKSSKKRVFNYLTRPVPEIESDETLEKAGLAKKLKSDGMSIADIAEKLNLGKGRVYQYLRD